MTDSESTPRLLVDASDGGSVDASKIDKKGFAAGVVLALTLIGRAGADAPSAVVDRLS